MLETSQLHTLVAVARAKSFSKAAEELHVTQSAISQSIKNLETKVEVRLFKRSGKKVVLTPEGEKLYELASDFLSQIDDVVDEIRHDKSEMSGKVRIGVLSGIGKSWLAPELLNISKDFPLLNININMGFSEAIVNDFEQFRLDFAILPEEDLPQIGERVFLSEEKATLVFPKMKDFEIKDDITLEKISSMPTILFESGDQLYQKWCRHHFGEVPKKINSRYVVNAHGAMLQAVNLGLGVAVIPTHVLKRSYYKNKVGVLDKKFEVPSTRLFLCYHKESEKMARVKLTLDRLLDSAKNLSSELMG